MNQAEVLIGAPPSWLELGPVVLRDGLPMREVLGDYSGRDECDRPPKFYIDGDGPRVKKVKGIDPNPVEQRLPGKNIAELKGIHFGAVALLFNGPSLSNHDLFRIKTPIIGMNRTHAGNKGYDGPQPDYLCVIDEIWFHIQDVLNHPGLINGGVNRVDKGHRATRSFRAAPFSFDLAHDGYVFPVPGTTGFLALQLAVYMGFDQIHCLGLDLNGSHFDGSTGSQHYNWMKRHFARMAPLLRERGIDVYVCGNPQSKCDVFPHSDFSAVC